MKSASIPDLSGRPVPRLSSPQPEVLVAALGLADAGRPEQRRLHLAFYDPALTAELFRLGSSRPRALDPQWTLDKLEQQFGDEMLTRVVVEASERLAKEYATYETQPRTTGFWLHCLACAHIARAIAEHLRYGAPDEAYIVGLLHDVGMMALAARQPSFYDSRQSPSVTEHELLADESAVLGVAHPRLGASMIDDWQLPAHLGDALLLHHMDPSELRGAHVLARILAAAEIFASGPTTATILESQARLLQLDVHLLAQSVNNGIQRALAAATEVGCGEPEVRMHFPGGLPQFAPPSVPEPVPAIGTPGAKACVPAARQVMTRLLDRARILGKVTEIARADDAQGAMLKLLDILEVSHGIQSFIVFLPDAGSESWAGWRVAPGGLEALNFRVPYSVKTSLVVAAAQGRTAVSAREDLQQKGLTGIDLQIARRLHGEDLLAVPAIDQGETCAIIVLSQGSSNGARVAVPVDLVTQLASGVARHMRRARATGRENRSLEKKVRDRVRGEVRQLLHEARNPLTILGNYLELASRRDGGDTLDDEMGVMRQELARVALILDRIGRLDEPASTRRADVDVNQIVAALVVAYRGPLFDSRQIVVGTQLAPTLPAIESDADAIRQILLNLLKNASEAMPDGGRVTLITEAKRLEGRHGVEIQIVDNGPGLPPDVVKRLERPGPRGDAPERGIGLLNCVNLVHSLQGRMSWSASPGGGATFRIFLPASPSRDPRKASEAS